MSGLCSGFWTPKKHLQKAGLGKGFIKKKGNQAGTELTGETQNHQNMKRSGKNQDRTGDTTHGVT